MKENSEQNFYPHPKQAAAFNSQKRIVMCCSGIQGGKSLIGALKLRDMVKNIWPENKYPDVNFAVCAPDYKSMHQSTRMAFDIVFQGEGHMNEMSQEFRLKDGRKIFFRTMIKNLNAVEGIPNCVFIWADEAAQYPRLAFINMQSRTSFMKGQLFLTTTPYAMNWPKKEVIDRFKQGDPDIDYFEWLSVENPAFPKDEYERQKKLLSQKEFERKYMGMHTRMEGLIFEDFDEYNWADPDVIDLTGAIYTGSIDWGFDHPFCINIRAITPDKKMYGVSFFKGESLMVSQQLDLIKAKHNMFHVKHWSCGHDRPEMIAELNRLGIPAFKYFEHQPDYREVNAGNQKHAEFIKTKQYRILTNVEAKRDLEDEYETYAWDKKEGQEGGKEKPVDFNDDLMATERYNTVGSLHLLSLKFDLPKIPLGYYQKIDSWKPTKKHKDSDSY